MASSRSIFSGSSRFASDFSAVIYRAVAIASLPMTQMQSSQARLQAETAALGGLNSKVTAVHSAITT